MFFTALLDFEQLESDFSCFVNYDNDVFLANIIPMLIITAITVVVIESTGIGEYKTLPLTDKFQMHSAS